ncbi:MULTISPECIES: HIT family protein [unclassified Butyrivibrio]|uniref:HIT family protein n=1 Tax=unclassified Butyrivibrio TaxID=2639466 RepID=UPI0004225188|nr:MULTISPECIES: HIT family protein [unclassified Butyrivibrio]SDB54659.1 histidine triad (HIT) family protein [Butyrivibrio sp. INlla16]
MKDSNCIFCKLANGEFPTNSIYEDDKFNVILDNGPATKGHCLILPKDHYTDIFELPEETAADAMKLAKKLAAHFMEKLGADGINIVQNNKEAAGQTVPHFHLHVIPRYKDDGQHILWNPTSPSAEELKALCETIKF